MPQMNLLPWREQARQESRLRFATTVLSYLVGAVLFLVFLHLYVTALIAYQNNRIAFLQNQLTQARMEIDNLNKKKIQTKQEEDKLNFIIGLRARSFRAVHLLNELAATIPTSITLVSVTRENDLVTLEGEAQSDLEITKLMKQLASLPGFYQPVLTEISARKENNETTRFFRLTVNQQ